MDTDSLGTMESVVSTAVLVFVLAVVLEILANAPVDIVEENPLGFLFDWMGELTDSDDGNDDGGGGGGLL